MNFIRGHSGTKVQCESCLFSQGKTPEFTKMGEIHELFVLPLSLVWFAGATPEYTTTVETFFLSGSEASMVCTLLSGPMLYIPFSCFLQGMGYNITLIALWAQRGGVPRWWWTLSFPLIIPPPPASLKKKAPSFPGLICLGLCLKRSLSLYIYIYMALKIAPKGCVKNWPKIFPLFPNLYSVFVCLNSQIVSIGAEIVSSQIVKMSKMRFSKRKCHFCFGILCWRDQQNKKSNSKNAQKNVLWCHDKKKKLKNGFMQKLPNTLCVWKGTNGISMHTICFGQNAFGAPNSQNQ